MHSWDVLLVSGRLGSGVTDLMHVTFAIKHEIHKYILYIWVVPVNIMHEG